MGLPSSILQAGTRAAQPAAITANTGQMYRVTDEGDILEQSTGAAWVPIGAGSIGPGGVTLEEVEALIAAASLGGAAQNSFLVSGGQVAWVSDYIFSVAAAEYYIDGVLYTSAIQPITLDAADPTNDRIDVIALDNTGTVVKITGTAAAQPSEPDVDAGTQLKLSFVLVIAASTEPAVTQELVYLDNAGSPTEWDWTASGSGFDVNSTTDPMAPATKCIEGTAVTAGSFAQGEIGTGTLNPGDYGTLQFFLKSKATWANNRGLSVSLRLAGVLVGSVVNITRTGTFGFASNNTTDDQPIAIPLSLFAVPGGSTIDQIRITDFGGSIGFFINAISFNLGATNQPATGITQEQADARYRRLTVDVPLADIAGASAASRLLGRGSAAGAGDWQEVTLGTGIAMAGTVLSATGSGGDVTASGTLTANQIILGGGTTVVAALGALGTTTTVLHGNAAGAPSFGAVALGADVSGTLPIANGGTGQTGQTAAFDALAPTTTAGDVSFHNGSDNVRLGIGTAGQVLTVNAGATAPEWAAGGAGAGNPVTVGVTVDGGGSVITTGIKGYTQIAVSGTITSWTLLASPAGDVEFDVYMDAFGASLPTTSIVAAAPPVLTADNTGTDSTLTGWTTAVTAGDLFGFEVISAATIQRVTLLIVVTP